MIYVHIHMDSRDHDTPMVKYIQTKRANSAVSNMQGETSVVVHISNNFPFKKKSYLLCQKTVILANSALCYEAMAKYGHPL